MFLLIFLVTFIPAHVNIKVCMMHANGLVKFIVVAYYFLWPSVAPPGANAS
jgi:hypothetical protein